MTKNKWNGYKQTDFILGNLLFFRYNLIHIYFAVALAIVVCTIAASISNSIEVFRVRGILDK